MTERKGHHNQNTVPVLDRNMKPLDPARPSRVRRWIESGRARKIWIKGIFAVQLKDQDAETAVTGNFAFNMDPGDTSGGAVTRESEDGKHRIIVGAYELKHRNQEIHRKLTQRSTHRRTRRGRLRRRPARYNNRANARTKGRLPPSIVSFIDDSEVLINTIRRLYPITQIRVEHLRFDTQLMQDPGIKGVQYQQGTLQHWQLKHYIFARDNWKCQYCDQDNQVKGKNHLTMDHVIPESRGGTTRPDNLVTACLECNVRKSNQPIEEFLTGNPELLSKIRDRVANMVPLASAGRLNTVMPAMMRVLESTGLPVTTSDGASTAYTRNQLGVPKSHVNDAACLDFPTKVENLDIPVTILRRQGRHNRQSINCNKNGSPLSKKFPGYSRLPRPKQGYTTPPSHSVGPRRLRGMSTGDLVRINHRSGQIFTGRAILQIKNNLILIKHKGHKPETVSVKASRATLIEHRSRWAISTRHTVTHQKDPKGSTSPIPQMEDA